MSKKNISAAIEDILDRIGEPATSVPSSADDLGMIPANAETIQEFSKRFRAMRMSTVAAMLQALHEKGLIGKISNMNLLDMILKSCEASRRNNKAKRLLIKSGLRSSADVSDIRKRLMGYQISESEYESLIGMDWIRGGGLLITGVSGCGKTDFASALCQYACLNGLSVLVMDYCMFINQGLAFKCSNFQEYQTYLKNIAGHNLVMLDDCFLSALQNDEPWCLKSLLDELADHKHGLILISQKTMPRMVECFAKSEAGITVIDRFSDSTKFMQIKLKGKSFRMNAGGIKILGGNDEAQQDK